MNYFRCVGGRSTHTATKIDVAKTPLASFESNVSGLYIPEILAYIQASQSGTGDPSPSNIRPIIGVSECNVVRCGVNVWDEEWEAGDISTNTGANGGQSTTRSRTKNYISIVPTEAYFCCGTANMYLFFYDKDKRYLGYHGSTKVNKVVIPANLENAKNPSVSFISAKYMRFRYDASTVDSVSINHPSTDHEYHAYTGNTYTIQLGGTYYGGYLNVTTGVLTVTHRFQALDALSWTKNGSTITFYSETLTGLQGETDDFYCSCYLPTINGGYNGQNGKTSIKTSGDISRIWVADNSYSTSEDFKASLTGQTAVLKLSTPIEVQLTPAQLEQLIGQNNVFCSSGDVAVKYWKID